MPTYQDIVTFENAAPSGVIRLVREGKFLRAYNHSAWLFHSCIAKHKVIRKYVKAIQSEVVYIGFPESNLSSTAGGRQTVKTELGFDITLRPEESPDEAEYELWRTTVEVVQASKDDFHALPLAGADAEREVIRLLRAFPIENSTLTECMVFLASLRRLLNNK